MDPRKTAESIIDRIFDLSEEDGRVIHRDRATDEAERIIRASMEAPPANRAVEAERIMSEWLKLWDKAACADHQGERV